jgi:hypothetical protein
MSPIHIYLYTEITYRVNDVTVTTKIYGVYMRLIVGALTGIVLILSHVYVLKFINNVLCALYVHYKF